MISEIGQHMVQSLPHGEMKRPRLNATADEAISEVGHRCDRWDTYVFLVTCYIKAP